MGRLRVILGTPISDHPTDAPQSRLEEERRKLRDDAEKERTAVLAKFSASHVSEREQELELELIQVRPTVLCRGLGAVMFVHSHHMLCPLLLQIQSEKSLLLLELSQVRTLSVPHTRVFRADRSPSNAG